MAVHMCVPTLGHAQDLRLCNYGDNGKELGNYYRILELYRF